MTRAQENEEMDVMKKELSLLRKKVAAYEKEEKKDKTKQVV